MDTWHSWNPEKKASGTEDMPPIMVTSGIFVHHQWWKIFRIQDPVFQKYARWTVEHSRRKIIETQATSMESIATLTCSTRHFVPQTSSVSAEQSERGVEQILEKASQSKLESARKTSRGNQFKQEDLKSLVDIPRLPYASGNRMLQILISVQRRNYTIRSRKETTMLRLLLKMTDGEIASQCAKNTQRPKTERIN